MNRFHCYVARTTDGHYARLGERVPGGVGHYIITTDDLTKAFRANTPADLMRELGVQYRRFYPVLAQIETEVLSQDQWPTEADVWGPQYAS